MTEKETRVKKSKNEGKKMSGSENEVDSSNQTDVGDQSSMKKVTKSRGNNDGGENVQVDAAKVKSKGISAEYITSGRKDTKHSGNVTSDKGQSKKQKKKRKNQNGVDEGSLVVEEVTETDNGGDRLSGEAEKDEEKTFRRQNSQGVHNKKTDSGVGGEKGRKKKNKKKKKKNEGPPKLSSERLLAFGINPKKVKYMNFNKFKEQTQV